MNKYTGFFNFYRDNENGELLLEISEFEREFLFINSLSQGMGSNDIGFDRGRINRERIVYFKQIADKVLLIQPNYEYRAITNNTAEKKAIKESFARSVLWGFQVVAKSDNKVLVDLTPFLLSDDQQLAQSLKSMNQGNYSVDANRSAVNMDRTKNFPQNSEFDALLTLTGNDPGNYVRSVTPTAELITINQHFSFVQLPDNNYKKRLFDPRCGFYGISYMDYATPIDQPLLKQFIVRHRLEKLYPEKDISPAKAPIVYYVDNGTPEPVRSALIEGASWWNQAFEAIGFENAFQVKVLPDDADPMDVRYNVIQWVHRSTRGWSYGNSVIDPRTGEIIKGHVSLGSLRVRQDFLIATGLLAPYKDGTTIPPEMEKMALARLRQLSAHEVGHTLGLMHNFAASYNNRASVMDYPHPLIKINSDSTFDLSDAYDTEIGVWDKIAIAYGYTDFNDSNKEQNGLKDIINDYVKDGLKYISDADARPPGGAHPYAHLWDNGNNPVAELNHILKVRHLALKNFSENVIRHGQPYSDIESVLVPVYLMHRYATEAAGKLIAGLEYSYAVRGDNQIITEFIDPVLQRSALHSILKTISAQNLQLNNNLLNLLPPHPPGFDRTRESFPSETGVTFDPYAAAKSAIQISLDVLMNSERLARVYQYHSRNAQNPSLNELLQIIFSHLFELDQQDGYQRDLQQLVQSVYINYLLTLHSDINTTSYVKSEIYNQFLFLKDWLEGNTGNESWEKHYAALNFTIQQYLKNPEAFQKQTPVAVPPGSPIGTDSFLNADCGLN
ncbi:MAG: zinc-dependent metalloprotease [Calditrichaeota bacterium]|nr:zinc-dependent metalloprotease [Calditrichota bacterium]